MNHNTGKDHKFAALSALLLISPSGFAHPVGGHDYSFFALLAHSIEHLHPLALLALPVIGAALWLWQERRAD